MQVFPMLSPTLMPQPVNHFLSGKLLDKLFIHSPVEQAFFLMKKDDNTGVTTVISAESKIRTRRNGLVAAHTELPVGSYCSL
jgi:hypothetical protein